MATTDGGYGAGQMPLAGAVLCCTSIAPELRNEIAQMGTNMGATIKLDLTSDVTHLIVGSTESAKYKYVARCREDVKVLSPSWLEALRQVWMAGHDSFDLAALEAEHRMPTFAGLKICLTGFDNPEQRRHIQDTVDANGAEYHGDLTKAVTHLVAATPSGKKYEHALNWRMKIVSLEWLQQSLERGMVLDEALYNPTMPPEQRGQGAWDRMGFPSPTAGIGKRARKSEPNQALNPLRRKLRRSASTKLGSQSEALWAGITAVGLGRQHDDDDDWTEESIHKQDTPQEHTHPSLPEDAGAPEYHAPPAADPASDPGQPSLPSTVDIPQGIFQGRIAFPHGFNAQQADVLRQHLQEHGARVLESTQVKLSSSEDLRHGYLVIPYDAEVDLTSLPERAGFLTVVTNWWVERCLYGKRLVDPAEDVLSRPFDSSEISGFSDLTINSTSFASIELLHVMKVVAHFGATYDELLSPKISVVVSNSREPNAQKFKYATERNIPIVHVAWLWECIKAHELQPFGTHQLNTTSSSPPQKPKPREAQQPPSEVPTARLSTEESFEFQRKKARSAKKTDKPRGSTRPRTLDLAPSADMSTTGSSINPNSASNMALYGQTDASIPNLDGQASLPLQDINANSPRRPSTPSLDSKPSSRQRSSSAESLIRPVPRKPKRTVEPTPDSVIPVQDSVIPADTPQEPPQEKDYSDILAQLRANRKALPSPADQGSTMRRRGRRQLGRATSAPSTESTAESSGQLNFDGDDDRETAQEYQPSQELGWDSPGAAKAREQMIQRLGGRVTDKSVRVEGIGVVRDVVSEGAGGRAPRKKREKGF